MIKILQIIFWVAVFSINAFSQKSANWQFGNGAALKFTTNGPSVIENSSINTSEGCATMSDDNGNLLFYTDGVTVWDKNNNIMFNGTGLRGGSSSSQSSIIVPAPGSFNKYYIFTSVQVESTTLQREYCYNLVDMGLRGGLGELVEKNIVFDTACSERLTAANNSNGTDFWIITNSLRSNTFKSFALTSTGLSTQPIINIVGDTIDAGIGMCKVSPDGKWLVQTFSRPNGLGSAQLFTFNSSNGQISNPISLNSIFNCTYGCAFSPNSKRLYLGAGFNCSGNPNNSFVQYTLTIPRETLIQGSRTNITINSPISASFIGDLSIGLDDKLYLARVGQKLSRFENPNDTGTNLIFTDNAVSFESPKRVNLGLPNFYNNINLPPTSIKVEKVSCLTYKFSFPSSNTFSFRGIYSWNFGDGTLINNDSIPLHTFKRSLNDSFFVTLNFRSPDNSVSVNQQVIVILPSKPITNFDISSNGCANSLVNFNSNSSSANGAITDYFWSLGDGTTKSIAQFSKKYNDTGNYLIKLLITDTLGCKSDTISTSVIINKQVTANFFLQGAYCSETALQLFDSSKSINVNINSWKYFWNNNNSYTSNTSGNFLPIFAKEDLYEIKLIVQTLEGCVSDTVTKNYFINNRPKANFLLPKNCILDLSNFISTSTLTGNSTINAYKWDFGVIDVLGDTSTLINPSYKYTAAKTYPVKLLVTSNQGCKDSIVQNFTVNGAVPIAKVSLATNPICSGDSAVLLNQSSVDFGDITKMEVTWGTTTITDNNPTPNNSYKFKFTEFGTPSTLTQPIKIKAFSGISCFSKIDTLIILKAQPRINFLLPIDSICGNSLSINLNQGKEINGTSGIFNYIGNGVRQISLDEFQFIPRNTPQNNRAAIKYQFITPLGCIDSVTRFIYVLPFPIANAGPDRLLIRGDSLIVNASIVGSASNITWSPFSLLNNPNILQPTVKTNLNATLQLTAKNNFGCIDTSSMRITVVDPIKPPNSFSPNSDGINDTWIIPNISLYPNCRVAVFTRTGQQVYESNGYNNPWNGQFNNRPLPTGTYYYIINLSSDKPILSGWIQIFR